LPVAGSDEHKRTNEIGMAIPLLATCDIADKDITGDALLTQRSLAAYVVEQQADDHFTVKSNQPALESDIALLFETRGAPDFVEVTPPDHGRIAHRKKLRPNASWPSTAGIGASKAFLTSSTGTTMSIAAESEPASAPKTSRGCAALPWAQSLQKPGKTIAAMMRKLTFRTRLVFDYLRMTQNSSARGFAN